MSLKWIAKAAVQKTISILPRPERVNLLFQRYVTGGVALTEEHFGYKITHARDHLNYLSRFADRPPQRILELGTGWYPIIPFAFYLTGHDQIVSVDIQNWLSREGQVTTIRKMRAWDRAGKLRQYLPGFRPDRWATLTALLDTPDDHTRASINELVGLTPLLQDARQLDFPDDHFDFICSNNTFEHVHAAVLEGILLEFKRLLRPGGLMSHFIDLSDHFAHFDGSITIYNFLRFSRRQWRMIDNNIQPQNRLRWPDYEAMYQRLGLPITAKDLRPGDPDALARVAVHPQFSDYSAAELAISHGYLVSRFG